MHTSISTKDATQSGKRSSYQARIYVQMFLVFQSTALITVTTSADWPLTGCLLRLDEIKLHRSHVPDQESVGFGHGIYTMKGICNVKA